MLNTNNLFSMGVLVFTAFLIWFFKNPIYLVFLAMLYLTRKKETKKDILEHFEVIHARLDLLVKQFSCITEKLHIKETIDNNTRKDN